MGEETLVALREWTLHYLQNKDLLTRQIVSIGAQQDGWDLILTTKTDPRHVKILKDLNELPPLLEKAADKNTLIVVPNTRQNLDALIAIWPDVIKHLRLTLLFVNPYSNLEKKWSIMPAVHERVSERKALRLGLTSLFSTVDEYGG